MAHGTRSFSFGAGGSGNCSHQSTVWVVLSLPRMGVVRALAPMKVLPATSVGEPEAQKVFLGFTTCCAGRCGLFVVQGYRGPGGGGRSRRRGRVVEHCFGLSEADEVESVV